MKLKRIDVARWVRGRVFREADGVFFDLSSEDIMLPVGGADADALINAIVSLCEELDDAVIAEALE